MAAETNLIAASDWSAPVDDLSGFALKGRLIIEYKGRENAVYVELQDASGHVGDARAVYFDASHDFRREYAPGLNCELLDSQGKAVRQTGFGYSGRCPDSLWIIMPSDSSVRLRANCFGIGKPKGEGLRISVPGKHWEIKAGDTNEYFLSGSFEVFPPTSFLTFTNGAKLRAWQGKIVFPRMRIIAKEP